MSASGQVRGELERLKGELGALCVALDPNDVPLPEAGAVWSAFDAVERLASGAKCRLARRVEESRAWQAAGARSAADHLAQLAGVTTGRARASLETSKALTELPGADAALARGELSDLQAEAVAGAAKADPSSEAALLALAKRKELRELRRAAARVAARAEDEAGRAQRLHGQRFLRTWTAADGSWNLMARNTPEAGAELEAALAPLKEAVFQAARLAGSHEPGEAYAADALAEVVRRAVAAEGAPRRSAGGPGPAGADRAGGGADVDVPAKPDAGAGSQGPARSETTAAGSAAGPRDVAPAEAPVEGDDTHHDDTHHDDTHHDDTHHDDTHHDDIEAAGPEEESPTAPRPARSRRPDTKVIVLISYESLKRGWAEADERCEIAGVGPISVATARSLMTDAFGAAIVTDGVDVFSVGHTGRAVTERQRSALEARGYRCEVPGCGAATALEIDHIEDWRRTFRTKLDQLCFLCTRHHRDKTHRGWRLKGPPGDRRWLAPGDVAPGDVAPAGEPAPDESTAAPGAQAASLFDESSAA